MAGIDEFLFALQTTVWGRKVFLDAHEKGFFVHEDGYVAAPTVCTIEGGYAIPITDPEWLLSQLTDFDDSPCIAASILRRARQEQPFAVRYNLQRMLQVVERKMGTPGFSLTPELFELIKQLAEK